jgi:hypothetical protein
MCLAFREQSDMVAENPQLILVVSIKLTQLRGFLFLNVDLNYFLLCGVMASGTFTSSVQVDGC